MDPSWVMNDGKEVEKTYCRKLFMVAKKVSLGNISPGFFCPLPQIIQKYNLIQSRSQEDRRATNPTNIAANHVFSLAWITR